jgi:hypothetical protein
MGCWSGTSGWAPASTQEWRAFARGGLVMTLLSAALAPPLILACHLWIR